MSGSIVVYDHSSRRGGVNGPLQRLAPSEWIRFEPSFVEDRNEKRLSGDLAQLDWIVAFAHVNDATWKSLLRDLRGKDERVIVRVSSNGLAKSPLESLSPLALRMNPRLDEIESADLERLANLLLERSIREELRREVVSPMLKPFLGFRQPHVASAAWIAGVAWLVCRIASEDLREDTWSAEQPIATSRSFLREVGWSSDFCTMCPADSAVIWPIVKEVLRPDVAGASFKDELARDLGWQPGEVPEWAERLSSQLARSGEPSIAELTEVLGELTRELRVAALR